MDILRTIAFAVVAAGLTSCSGLGSVPREVASALSNPPTNGPSRIYLIGERITAWAVALAPDRMPPGVQRAAEAVQPDGELTYSAHAWFADGSDGYVVEKRYTRSGETQFRSVWIDARAEVISRSHSIPLHEAPQAVRNAVEQQGVHARFEFVQIGTDRDLYRATYEADGAPSVRLTLRPDGFVVQRDVTIPAEIVAGR